MPVSGQSAMAAAGQILLAAHTDAGRVVRRIDFLTCVGQTCDDRRQEFILLSDTLGVSMLVEMRARAGAPGTRSPRSSARSTSSACAKIWRL